MINKKILIIGAVAVLLILVFSTIMPLSFFVDTNTEAFYYPEKDASDMVFGVDSTEMCDETELVTAWKDNGNSVKLKVEGNTKAGGECFPLIGRYYTGMYYFKVYLDDGSGWEEIMWGTSKGKPAGYDRDLLHITPPGFFGMEKFSRNYKEIGCNVYDENDEITGGNCWIYNPQPSHREPFNTKAYGLELLGPHVGGLRVELWWQVGKSQCHLPPYSGLWPRLMLRDEVKLVSGKGELSIVGNAVTYEEGSTITFAVETDYSGKRQSQQEGHSDVANDGWELRIFNSAGLEQEVIPVADKFRGEIPYDIPAGSYIEDGNNQWKVELWNTLFNQKEVFFFTIGEGMMELTPDTPIIQLDKVTYNMGDVVYVTVQSQANIPNHDITEFFIRAYYDVAGTDYVYPPNYIPASGSMASFSFDATRGDRYITIEATAFDGYHNQGGLPSEYPGKKSVYVKDKNPEPDTFVLEVFIRDQDTQSLINGAFVDIGSDTGTTVDGVVHFIGIPGGTKTITASNDGYKTKAVKFVLDTDSSTTVYLTRGSDIDFVGIIVSVLIFVIMLVVAIVLPVPTPIKILIAVIGVVLAILIYFLLFGGIL